MPWLNSLWETLSRQRHELSHALLLSGPAGVGKNDLALALADLLLCRENESYACGHCQVCVLGQAGSLPDLHVVAAPAHAHWLGGRVRMLCERYGISRDSKAKPSEHLRIDQIRHLLDNVVGTPHIARYRVVVIAGADRMNTAAANALLKMLEEPPQGTWFILTTDAVEKLPATVRSRCMLLNASTPDASQAHVWLERTGADVSNSLLSLAAGGPLQARRLSESDVGKKTDQLVSDYLNVIAGVEDPIAVAAKWPVEECELLLKLLQTVLADLVRIRTYSQTDHLALPEERDRLQAISLQLDLRKAHGVYSRLNQSVQIFDVALNNQLLVEDLLIRSARMLNNSTHA